jgi:hypothetical protein
VTVRAGGRQGARDVVVIPVISSLSATTTSTTLRVGDSAAIAVDLRFATAPSGPPPEVWFALDNAAVQGGIATSGWANNRYWVVGRKAGRVTLTVGIARRRATVTIDIVE